MVGEDIHPPRTGMAAIVVEAAAVEDLDTLIIVVFDFFLLRAATTIFLVFEIHEFLVLQFWSLDCLLLHRGKI